MVHASKWVVSLTLAALLAGCGGKAPEKELDKLDAKLGSKPVAGKAGDADPALTSALEDQILVDPQLANQSNKNAARPTNVPLQAQVPADVDAAVAAANAAAQSLAPTTLGTLAARQSSGPKAARFKGCGVDVAYSMAWADRLPADVQIYPQGRVSEAAGSDAGTCRLRAVSYSTTAPMRTVIDFYLSNTRRAGFSSDYDASQSMIGGARDKDGAAWYAIVQPTRGGGTLVDLVTNNGR
jgi:hypothetical protein